MGEKDTGDVVMEDVSVVVWVVVVVVGAAFDEVVIEVVGEVVLWWPSIFTGEKVTGEVQEVVSGVVGSVNVMVNKVVGAVGVVVVEVAGAVEVVVNGVVGAILVVGVLHECCGRTNEREPGYKPGGTLTLLAPEFLS